MKFIPQKYIVLILLAGVFAAPGFFAYYFFQHPQWLTKTTINKGRVLMPPAKLHSLTPSSQWHLLLWQAKSCEQDCLKQLEQLARIRLALGRRVYDVDVRLITTTPLSVQYIPRLQQQAIQFQVLKPTEANTVSRLSGDHSQILLANREGLLLLTYPVSTQPGDIFNDLKHLLTQG